MLYGEMIAVCSEFHTKHINTLCTQSVELLNVKLVVHIVTTFQTFNHGTFSEYKMNMREEKFTQHFCKKT